MARQVPRAASIEPAPSAEEDGLARFGEVLRRAAIGLTATLLVVRAYWPSEDAAAGTGLTWVAALLAVVGLGVISMLAGGNVRFRLSWADVAFYALVGLVGLSASVAPDRRAGINLAWEWGGLGAMFLLLRCLPRSRDESSTLAGLLAATAAAVASYGLYQVAVELPEMRRVFLANPEAALMRLGIAPGSSGETAFRARVLASKEPFSTFGGLANSLAGYLVGPLVLGLAVAVENLRREGRGSRIVGLALAAIPGAGIVVCLALTKSRSAWIGLAVATLLIAWRARRGVPGRVLAAAGVVAAVGLIALVAALATARQLDREVVTEARKSLGFRLQYWAAAVDILRDAPPPFPPPAGGVIQLGQEIPTARPESRAFWRGLGPGNFAGPYLRHKRPEASEEIADPHNVVLDVWCTAGLPALLAFLAALGLGVRETLRPPSIEPVVARTAGSAWLIAFGASAWVAVVAFGKLDPFAGDLLGRWLVLGFAWIASVWLGARLWSRRPIPAWGAGLGVVAIAVNLLAAGGINMPAVALPFWGLLALGLNLRDDRPCGVLRERTGLGWGIGAALGWSALVGSFAGAIGPFWVSEIALAQGDAALRTKPPAFEVAREGYRRAIDADRANVAPWLRLAELEYAYARSPEARMRSEVWERVFLALDKAIEPPWRNADSLAVRRLQYAYAQSLARALVDPTPRDLLSLRSKAVRAARKAAELYPTAASLRAQLATASAEIGMFGDAVAEAEQALKLDALTPHREKGLSPEIARELREKLPGWIERRDNPPAPPR